MARADPELRLTEPDLDRLHVVVAEHAGSALGVASLDAAADPPVVGHLFVDPSAMGAGVGALLMAALADEARRLGVAEIELESDPNAEGFYARMGAHRVGDRASSSTGRVLPLMRMRVG
jgi:GNAT superfamily N-acetyltransferase